VKLDSSILKQLIKEELQNLLQEQPLQAKLKKRRERLSAERWEKLQAKAVDYKRKAADIEAKKAAKKAAETKTEKPAKTEKPTTTKKAETKKTAAKVTPAEENKEKRCQQGEISLKTCKELGHAHPQTGLDREYKGGKEEDDKGKKKSTFSREQGSLRRKINQLKKDGKIDEKTWRAARNALYKGTGAANAVLQKAGVGARGAEGTRTAGGVGRYRRAQQPLTQQEHATTKRLYNAVKELQAVRHPQLQNIWQAIMRAARGGHRVAAAVINHIQKEEQERKQVTQATQTRGPGRAGLS
jgi:hypothetical protein